MARLVIGSGFFDGKVREDNMLSDAQIANQCELWPISRVAESVGITEQDLEFYGKYKAKLSRPFLQKLLSSERPDGKLILVTAINPTPAGEGKTTTSISLGQALNRLGKKGMLALREPSLGPVFGIKGGAAGGGYSQVLPMEDINLHFTGDFHAVTTANNLLCAMIDNHLHQGNELGLDPKRIQFHRVMDMNDRALRNIVVGMGSKSDGVMRSDGFSITAASEIMAILCLADSMRTLKEMLGNILVGYTFEGRAVFCRELDAVGAMAAVLKDALLPNLVQTIEHTPCLIHGGPFANIAHGCNSVIATRAALKLADYVVTEAGFGADLGAEKFFDIKCRRANLVPDTVVLVATVRALKYNGGAAKDALAAPDPDALKRGLVNLEAHIDNLRKYRVPIVVAVNHFESDSEEECELVRHTCANRGVSAVMAYGFAQGGEGAVELCREVLRLCENDKPPFQPLYDTSFPIRDKIEQIAREIYGAKAVDYEPAALAAIREIESLGFSDLPICMAKTQYSLSDDPKALGRPTGFTLHVREIRLSAGAGFIVALTGAIMTMPGLPRKSAAASIDVGEDGTVEGIF